MAAGPLIEIYVKGTPATQERGDCPFCHRALLTLAEKHVPYKEEYIDFADKPKWLFDISPKGAVPVMKDLENDKWIADSGDIVDYLEDKFPEVPLGKQDARPHVAQKLFPSFVAALKADGAEFKEKEEALVGSLTEIDEYMQNHKAYLGGDRPNAVDCMIAPRLYHIQVAMKELKGWEIPSNLTNLHEYITRMQSRDSWKQTYYSPDKVLAGWKAHLAS
ncbi:g3490 [Coccomyxa viridis]|uniref:glutathione dehydrogenase (ascorbate) n=1 Tax=Coccomyxa viridis TaxID=1274662 RepID=A0ABP1FMX3_9CHLO